ncbi:MAG: hypothetical protein WCI72_03890 [archaeon]
MDKPRVFSVKKREALRRIFQRDKVNYIHSLAPLSSSTCREVRREESLAGYLKYEELKKKGELPLEFRVLENILNNSHPLVCGDISNDPAYKFLIEVSGQLDHIIAQQYVRSEEFKEIDSGEDFDVYRGNKEDFLYGLLSSFTERSAIDSGCDWSSAARINTESRYNYLVGLASLEGEGRQKAIEGFVKSFPNYFWDNFYWPNENVVGPVSPTVRAVVSPAVSDGEEHLPF